MASQELDQQLHALVERVAVAHDLVVEQASASLRGKRRSVRVVLDLADGPGSLGSDLLGDVTREISDALDASELVDGAYTLEVSSPGTSRPLTTPRHFRRAQRRLVRLTLADGSTLTARVTDADETGVTVTAEPAGARTVPYEQITAAVVEVELRRLEEEN